MKYIVFEAPTGEAPVLFPRSFQHRYVAQALAPLRPLSAGFVEMTEDGPRCHGRSAGLHLPARPERDTDLVRRAMSP